SKGFRCSTKLGVLFFPPFVVPIDRRPFTIADYSTRFGTHRCRLPAFGKRKGVRHEKYARRHVIQRVILPGKKRCDSCSSSTPVMRKRAGLIESIWRVENT